MEEASLKPPEAATPASETTKPSSASGSPATQAEPDGGPAPTSSSTPEKPVVRRIVVMKTKVRMTEAASFFVEFTQKTPYFLLLTKLESRAGVSREYYEFFFEFHFNGSARASQVKIVSDRLSYSTAMDQLVKDPKSQFTLKPKHSNGG